MIYSGLSLILSLFIFLSGCILSRVNLHRLRQGRLILGREEEYTLTSPGKKLFPVAFGRTGKRSHLLFPLFDVSYRLVLVWHRRQGGHRAWRRWETILPLCENDEGVMEMERSGLLRGDYRGRDGFLITDWFGFFRFSLVSSRPLVVRVMAREEEGVPGFPPSLQADGVSSFLALPSEVDPVENRPYVPGDDPRKINWKQYAHFDGFFVRTAHEPLPHNKWVLCLFSVENCDLAEVDRCAGYFMGLCRLLEEKGCQVFTLLPGQVEMGRTDFSGIPSAAPGDSLSGPRPSPGHVLFVGKGESGEEALWHKQALEQGVPFSFFDPLAGERGGRG